MTLLSDTAVQHFIDMILNGPARYTVRHHFNNWQTLVFVLVIPIAEFEVCYGIFYGIFIFLQNIPALFSAALRRFGVGEQDIAHTFLELTFPADTSKSAFANEQLHVLLRGMVKYYGFWDKRAARKKPYSYEFVGTNDKGIRFILMVPTSEADIVQRNLLSFLPGLKVKEISDYAIDIPEAITDVVELNLTADFILPLKDHKTLEEHDLIAFLSGHMTKLSPDELVAYQIVCVPVYGNTHHRIMRRRKHIRTRLALGKEVMSQIKQQRTPIQSALYLLWYPIAWFLLAVSKVVMFVGGFIAAVLLNTESHSRDPEKRRSDNPYDREMGQIIKSKLDQQLYEVTVRILVSSPDAATHYSRINAMVESFKPFRSTYQSFGTRQHVPVLSPKSKNLKRFKQRTLSPHYLSQQTVLSNSELSDLYHFPNTDLTKTQGLVKSRSRELAAPLSIKHSEAKLDVIVGVNEHGGDYQAIGMTLEQREKHTYIIGKTGTGKTTMLKSSIYQDMLSGKGLAVLDPHGDMFQELLGIVPKNRQEDVVIFDPSDSEWPVGLNILDPGIEFVSEDVKHAKIASMVLSVFKKLADDSQWGPRMEHILRNTTLTALQLSNPSLYTLQRLLTDKKYQREVAKTLDDPILKQFWDKEFKLLGTMQMSTVTAPLTHRLGHFITSKMSRHILLQEKSTIRIADIINEGKILLVNLSKGDIGEDQSQFFGTLITSLIWMAAYQRTRIPEKQRRDFFVYVDEFQNFATPQFSEITSEGRKYHIALIVSHQNIAQIEDKSIVKVVASNASTIICLKVGPEDETFILPYMKPEVENGDIVNLAPYHFYMKTTGDISEDAFSGVTVPLDAGESDETRDTVIAYSRKQYALPKTTIEEYLKVLFGQEEKSTKDKPESGGSTTMKGSRRTGPKQSSNGESRNPKRRGSGRGHVG